MLNNHNHRPLTWVIVADSCRAKVYRMVKFAKIEPISTLKHPESRLKDQDLISTKPGRNFQSGGISRHAYQQETDPKHLEAIHFASELTQFLTTALNNREYNRLYVIAEPAFLGLLRQHFNPQVRKAIVGEEAKQLTSHQPETIEQHLLAM